MENIIWKQIKKFLSNFRGVLHKHRHALSFPSDPYFAGAQLAFFREGGEAPPSVIVRGFSVDLTLIGMDAVNATGRVFYGDKSIVAAMPRATATAGEIHFFKPRRFNPTEKFDDEHSKRGLVPADPHTLAGFVSANQEFVDDHPLGTKWLDENGNVCFVTFDDWGGRRRVLFGQGDFDSHPDWWLAGVLASSSPD